MHCDLISKIPRPSQSVPFARVCYEPLVATRTLALALKLRPARVLSPTRVCAPRAAERAAFDALGGSLNLTNEDHAGVTSERLLIFRLGCETVADSMPALSEAARAYLNHWLALHELGDLLRLPTLGVVPVAHAPPPAFAAGRTTANSTAPPAIGTANGAAGSPPRAFTRSAASTERINDLVGSLWQFSTAVAMSQRAASAAFFDGSPELLDSLDKSVRARLFSPTSDSFWAYIDRLLGEQAAAALHDLLCDSQVRASPQSSPDLPPSLAFAHLQSRCTTSPATLRS